MIGKTLAHYEILEALGTGGMGEVYLALDTRLNRKVALKTLRADGQRSPLQLTRLRREAQAAAALNHPGVVTVYAVEEAEGILFITMEHIVGRTLSALIEPGGMTASVFRDLAGQIAAAVAAAHAAGVVHRDLKPANVMLDDQDRVKVLDFGLARIARPAAKSLDRTLSFVDATIAGTIKGTMPYMSPEQVRAEAADARSDVFALGTVFYEMATGTRPFNGESAVELASAILRDTPRPVAEMRPGFPAELAGVINTCQQKEHSARYADAGEVATALSRARVQPPLAVPDTETGEVTPLLGVMDFTNITGDPDADWLATGIAESVTVDLNKLPGVHTMARDQVIAALLGVEQREEAATTAAVRQLGLDFLITGGYQKNGERLRITGQVLDVQRGSVAGVVKLDGGMEDIFELQDRILTGLLDSARLPIFGAETAAARPRETGRLQAYELYARAKAKLLHMGVQAFGEAEELLREALKLDPDYALAHTAFGQMRAMRYIATTDKRDLDEAIEHLEIARRVDPDLDEPLVWLTYCLGRLDRFDEAIAVGEKAIALNPSRPQAHYFTGVAHWMRGASNFEPGDWDAVVRHLGRATKLQPTYQPAFMGRCDVLARLGRWDEAHADAEFAAELEASGRWEVAAFFGAETQFGYLELAKGRFEEAARHFRVSEQRLEQSTHVYAPVFLATNHCGLARVEEAQGESEQAVARLRGAREVGERHPRTLGMGRVLVRVGYTLGSVLAAAGRREEAATVLAETDRFLAARDHFDFSAVWLNLDAELHMEGARAWEILGEPERVATARQAAVANGWPGDSTAD